MRAIASTLRLLPALLAASLPALLTACADSGSTERLPFSETLISDYALDNEHRQHLQYYLSNTIELYREVSEGQHGVAHGRLVSRSGTWIEEVKIPRGTPGVVVGSGNGWVAVSFAPGSYLYFVSEPAGGYFDNDHQPDRFYLFSPDNDGRHGTVRFAGADFEADRDALRAYLLVDQDSLSHVDGRESTLPGRWLVERH